MAEENELTRRLYQIEGIMMRLRAVWKSYPEQRLGVLIMSGSHEAGTAPLCIEDDSLICGIEHANAPKIMSESFQTPEEIGEMKRRFQEKRVLKTRIEELEKERSGRETRIAELTAAIKHHRDQKEDDRCWMDDHQLYSVLGDGILGDNRIGDPIAMLQSCCKFIQNRCQPGGTWVSRAELEKQNKELQDEVDRLRKTDISVGWLLEIDQPGGAVFFDGYNHWVDAVSQALRFARKEDAEKYKDSRIGGYMHLDTMRLAVAREHYWV